MFRFVFCFDVVSTFCLGLSVLRSFAIITIVACCLGLFVSTQSDGFQAGYSVLDRFITEPLNISESVNGTSPHTPEQPSIDDRPPEGSEAVGGSSDANIIPVKDTPTDAPADKEEQSPTNGGGKDDGGEAKEEHKEDGPDGDNAKEKSPAAGEGSPEVLQVRSSANP